MMFRFDGKPSDTDKEVSSVGQRILGFCFAVFCGAILLYLAIDLLGQIWPWVLLIVLIAAAARVAFFVYQ